MRVFDPEASLNARAVAPELTYVASVESALRGADLVLLLTEWPQFSTIEPYWAARLVRDSCRHRRAEQDRGRAVAGSRMDRPRGRSPPSPARGPDADASRRPSLTCRFSFAGRGSACSRSLASWPLRRLPAASWVPEKCSGSKPRSPARPSARSWARWHTARTGHTKRSTATASNCSCSATPSPRASERSHRERLSGLTWRSDWRRRPDVPSDCTLRRSSEPRRRCCAHSSRDCRPGTVRTLR